ncbi:MAG: hypothetical protein GY803_25740 [Chloroflexi bacterium]|nr:hypothetical protein [Chloroflexota bacterium]
MNNRSITQYMPILDWSRHYRRDDLVGDLMAGVSWLLCWFRKGWPTPCWPDCRR